MVKLTGDEERLKQLLKEAVIELIQERSELFSTVIADALEDAGMLRAIQEGESSEPVSRSQVMAP